MSSPDAVLVTHSCARCGAKWSAVVGPYSWCCPTCDRTIIEARRQRETLGEATERAARELREAIARVPMGRVLLAAVRLAVQFDSALWPRRAPWYGYRDGTCPGGRHEWVIAGWEQGFDITYRCRSCGATDRPAP